MSRFYTPITDNLANYIRAVTLREPEALRKLREETENHPRASCQVSPEQGQFLHLLARLTAARKAIEVGVFMGYSSTWMALALPADGKLLACDVNEEYTARARQTWREAGVEERIELRLAPALETLDGLLADGQAGTFDLVFIDADKETTAQYFDWALRLTRPGSLIVVDNVVRDGRVADEAEADPRVQGIRAFHAAIAAEPRVTATAIQTVGQKGYDGFTLALVTQG